MFEFSSFKFTFFKCYFFIFFLILFYQSCLAAEYSRYKYSLDKSIPLTPSISAAVVSLNGKLGYDSSLKKFFFRGTILEEHYKVLLNCISQEDIRKKLKDTYDSSEYMQRGTSGDLVILLPVLFAYPPVVEGVSLYAIISGVGEKSVTSIAGRNKTGKAYAYTKTNEEYIWQPMALVNAVFLAINLTNPWLSLAGNGLALFTFAQNSPLPEFKKNAFPCSIFDKALYDSSLMSEELWAEFKLAGYYNDNDQLNDKFFQDYKDKKLLIPEKFKPYEAGIYEAFDIYLKENAEKFPTQNINPAAQRQPLSAILPQTK